MVALVRLRRGAEPRELAHRPEPIAITVGMNASGVRVFAGPREIARQIEGGQIARLVDLLQRNVRDRAVGGSGARPASGPAFRGRVFPAATLLVEFRALRR